ncbi:putative endonuclease distantly related to archaeal Holliday junction resolvase [Yersinia rohdei]|uniref:UPF0102 protein ERS008555_00449 n=2 Tax=Yersinia rohdei TaxID=29485 RepID=A0A0U1HNT8_YERRO|nr:putative endonuclease distantly related to archaeal Holliday junction resolvase [Yersinia rohdei]CQI88118.1 putative endonuclease distantly related to archaeal Holliday junction resolvase [Yersinia rohdei]CQJ57985.1 putative endonuclease distantly related to archaeal Holliday junction resolvase [Yersinia rohdei]
MSQRMTHRNTGTHYENQARRYLERAGLLFQAANVTYQSGEIDLIMRDGATWVFVEVRFRRNALFGGAAASVTYSKQQRLLRAAALWLAQRNASFATTPCRFDVFAITGSQVEWLPNAFNAD